MSSYKATLKHCFTGIGVSTNLPNMFSRFPTSKIEAELEYPSKMAALKEERDVEDYKRKGRRSSQVREFLLKKSLRGKYF